MAQVRNQTAISILKAFHFDLPWVDRSSWCTAIPSFVKFSPNIFIKIFSHIFVKIFSHIFVKIFSHIFVKIFHTFLSKFFHIFLPYFCQKFFHIFLSKNFSHIFVKIFSHIFAKIFSHIFVKYFSTYFKQKSKSLMTTIKIRCGQKEGTNCSLFEIFTLDWDRITCFVDQLPFSYCQLQIAFDKMNK